jgi:hypothetical protein
MSFPVWQMGRVDLTVILISLLVMVGIVAFLWGRR